MLRGSRRHERWRSRRRGPLGDAANAATGRWAPRVSPAGGYIDLDPAEALVRQLSPLDAAFVYGETPTSPTGSDRIRRNQDTPLG